MKTIQIATQRKDQVIDITDKIEDILTSQSHDEGICVIFVAHTTCGLTTADLDPGTDLDLLDGLRGILPQISYRHPHDPTHTPDHILSSMIGPSVSVPFENKKLYLGVWQKIVLIELDGPRDRNLSVSIIVGE